MSENLQIRAVPAEVVHFFSGAKLGVPPTGGIGQKPHLLGQRLHGQPGGCTDAAFVLILVAIVLSCLPGVRLPLAVQIMAPAPVSINAN